MSSEALGEIVTGTMAARAAEPGHGEGDDGHSHESACLNCGAALVGPHCHQCGQAAHVHKTLGAFFHDLLHGVFHFEGKIWRTLPLLVWNPGRLTREYVDGRRASYVSPIALFLFCVFLMFAVVKEFASEFDPGSFVRVNDQVVNEALPVHKRELAALKVKRAQLRASGADTGQIDGEIAGKEEALRVMQQVKDVRLDKVEAHSSVPAVDRAFRSMKTDPGLVIYKLQTNAYKFSWALIPISVPFVWLLFAFRRRFGIYDHTVFVTYSLCFMSLLVVMLTLALAAGLPAVLTLAVLLPPLHMARQLRGAYQLGWRATLWRTAALMLIAVLALTAFAVLILAQSG